MVIFPLAPDQTIAQMWSNGARGGIPPKYATCNVLVITNHVIRRSTTLQMTNATMMTLSTTTTARIMLTFCIQYKSSKTTHDFYTGQQFWTHTRVYTVIRAKHSGNYAHDSITRTRKHTREQ